MLQELLLSPAVTMDLSLSRTRVPFYSCLHICPDFVIFQLLKADSVSLLWGEEGSTIEFQVKDPPLIDLEHHLVSRLPTQQPDC